MYEKLHSNWELEIELVKNVTLYFAALKIITPFFFRILMTMKLAFLSSNVVCQSGDDRFYCLFQIVKLVFHVYTRQMNLFYFNFLAWMNDIWYYTVCTLQGNLNVDGVFGGIDSQQLKGSQIIAELKYLLNLLTLCWHFSKKPFPLFLEETGYSEENVLLQEPKAGVSMLI